MPIISMNHQTALKIPADCCTIKNYNRAKDRYTTQLLNRNVLYNVHVLLNDPTARVNRIGVYFGWIHLNLRELNGEYYFNILHF